MSQAFEDFLSGKDKLSALLRALPAYAPSPALEAAFAAAARAAQQEHTGACENLPSPQGFAPPASLETNFLKMASSIDAAQAQRRDVLLTDIANGASPEASLGAPLQPATISWLQTQAAAKPTAPTKKPARPPVWFGFSWFDIRLAGLTGLLAAVAVQLVLKYQPSPHEVAVQDTFREALVPRPEDSIATLEQTAERSIEEAKLALAQANAAREQQQNREANKAKAALGPDARPAPQAPGNKASSADIATAPAEIDAPAHLIASAPKSIALSDALSDAPAAEPRSDSLSTYAAPVAAPMAPALAGSLDKSVASRSPQALNKAEAPIPRERGLGEAAAEEKKSAEAPPKLAKRATQPDTLAARRAAIAPVVAAAAPMPSPDMTAKLDALRESTSARLADAPADVAARLPLRPAGQVWAIYSAAPERADVRAWVAALRQSIPANHRPDRFLIIKEDGPPDMLRIMAPPLAQ